MINAEYHEIDKRKMAISDEELSKRLARVCSHTDPEVYRVYEAVMREIEPRYAVTRVKISVTDEEIDLGFCKTRSNQLRKRLSGCDEAFLLVVTLGGATDRLIARLMKTSKAEAFIFDAVASALAEAAVEVANTEVTEGLSTTTRFSPGYSDFPLECQGALLDYLGAPTYLGVTLTDSLLMLPQKTVSCVIGILGS